MNNQLELNLTISFQTLSKHSGAFYLFEKASRPGPVRAA
jgi:hypothetical protein